MRELLDTRRIADAASFAVHAHHGQTRKIEETPYVGHVFAVAGLVADYGGTTDQIVAALLHDVVEDTEYTIYDVRDRFGDGVAELVHGMSEKKDLNPYRERKREYAERLVSGPEAVALIALADKTHNLETSLRHLDEGHAIKLRFPSIDWYNRLLLDALRRLISDDAPDGTKLLLARYERAVESLEEKLHALA